VTKILTLASLWEEKLMDMEYINGLQERNMMGSGKEESDMERVSGRVWKEMST